MLAAAAAGPHPRIEEVVVEKSDFALTLSPKTVAHVWKPRPSGKAANTSPREAQVCGGISESDGKKLYRNAALTYEVFELFLRQVFCRLPPVLSAKAAQVPAACSGHSERLQSQL